MRRRRTAPDIWWTDPATDDPIRRLTWLEWIHARELMHQYAGKPYGHQPGLWRRLGLS